MLPPGLAFEIGCHEGQCSYRKRQSFSAQFSKYLCSGRGEVGGDISHRHRPTDSWAKPTRSDRANRVATFGSGKQVHTFTHRCAPLRTQPHALARGTRCDLGQNGIGTGEAAFALAPCSARLLDRPFQRGFDRGGGRVDAQGDYVWNLWRPYSCCQDRGIFLFNVDWINYPP